MRAHVGPGIVVTVGVGIVCPVMHSHVVAHSFLLFVNEGVGGSQVLSATVTS